MTETYSGELSREAKLALSRLFPLIDRWRQRMESAPATPDADSSLFEDDLAAFPYLVSQAVGAQLVSAADHWMHSGCLWRISASSTREPRSRDSRNRR